MDFELYHGRNEEAQKTSTAGGCDWRAVVLCSLLGSRPAAVWVLPLRKLMKMPLGGLVATFRGVVGFFPASLLLSTGSGLQQPTGLSALWPCPVRPRRSFRAQRG